MSVFTSRVRHSLISRLIFTVGLALFFCISTWAWFNIRYQKNLIMEDIITGTDRLSTTIKLGTHYAMMLNSRNDINQIITNIGKQKDLENIRIYNKVGEIKFSNHTDEVDEVRETRDEPCFLCHKAMEPLATVSLAHRTRILDSSGGYRRLGIVSPIENEPGCYTAPCHVHPEDKQILGVLDVVVSLKTKDEEVLHAEKGIMTLTVFVFLVTSMIIFLSLLFFVRRPIKQLIDETERIGKGEYGLPVPVSRGDEIGQLAMAINSMSREIGEKQAELNKQRDEYQTLFEEVPCIITVQDRNYRLLKYNREFAEKFDPTPGDYCYRAYKGRSEKCPECPVEKTFRDGLSHYSEEIARYKDGQEKHWIVSTSPITNSRGEVVAAMEINLDITQRKLLEEKLIKSEKKYHAIFNNIPNPVFVLDSETLEILNCNQSVSSVYGYSKEETKTLSFGDLFEPGDRAGVLERLKSSDLVNQVRQRRKDGNSIFVNIRISPSEYHRQKVLLVTVSDITKRLETEQQLIHASKMATLGEMATGVAHELNQPLSVIKTASSFFMKKIRKEEPIKDSILLTLSEEIDSHVDRATKIINHMRQFGRKSDMTLERFQVNRVLRSGFEIFSQQLKLREIEVIWDLDEDLPRVMIDPGRLEQVFINLLINARDAIEERWSAYVGNERPDKRINLATVSDENFVIIEVCDTGSGVPKHLKDKIFEPFFTTKKVGEGTGIGLSISYGIIQECKGTIRVGDSKGGGACFTIKFPIPPQGAV